MDIPTSSSTEKKKPGPAPKPKLDTEQLLARIHNLEQLVVRMAHNAGVSHVLIKQAGLAPYQPTQNDMTKFKRVV